MASVDHLVWLTRRLGECLVGCLAAAAGAAIYWLGLLTFEAMFDSFPGPRPPFAAIRVVLAIFVGSWCMQLAWRLFSGHERKWGGGLLSPLVLFITALVMCGGAAYVLWERGPNAIGFAVLCVISAAGTLSLAAVQRRRAREQQVKAKNAF